MGRHNPRPTGSELAPRSRRMKLAVAISLAALAFASDALAQQHSPMPATTGACSSIRCTTREPAYDSPVLWLPRLLLAPLRLGFRTATELLMVAPRLEDDHQLTEQATDIFFDDTRTYGLYPTAFYETGLSPNVGARFVHRNLLSKREQLRVRVGYGGPENQIYAGQFHSGTRFGFARLSAELEYRLLGGRPFYGVGNADLVEASVLRAKVRALDAPVAIETRYRRQELRARFGASVPLTRHLRLGLSHAWLERRLEIGERRGADRPWVTDVFAGDTVVGFDRPSVYSQSRAVLWLSDLQRSRADLPPSLPSSGAAFAVWSGLQHELTSPEHVFGRVGVDVQPFFDLYRGDRVLRLRFRTAWVIGQLARTSFVDLPSLGGARRLRGYPNSRFRGRGTVLATAEYRYPVQENVASYVFVDAGRAFARFEHIWAHGLQGARIGFGAGLRIYHAENALLSLQLASSIDGGLFFSFLFDASDEIGPSS